MNKYLKKQSTITSLLAVPLIASAILFSSPAFASSNSGTPNTEITGARSKRGIVGKVTSVNGMIITVTARDGIQYSVDASTATIMKASDQPDQNPVVVNISDIHVGDTIGVRGKIDDTEISANKIFDGKMPMKHLKHRRHMKHHGSN
ncbi:hypothetical protein K2P96_00320 [Patescibacteria group bacterium]|nr:hypothetical protein [Patescibacteria group bacterium]